MVFGVCSSHPKVIVPWEVGVQDKLLHSVGHCIKQHILQEQREGPGDVSIRSEVQMNTAVSDVPSLPSPA